MIVGGALWYKRGSSTTISNPTYSFYVVLDAQRILFCYFPKLKNNFFKGEKGEAELVVQTLLWSIALLLVALQAHVHACCVL